EAEYRPDGMPVSAHDSNVINDLLDKIARGSRRFQMMYTGKRDDPNNSLPPRWNENRFQEDLTAGTWPSPMPPTFPFACLLAVSTIDRFQRALFDDTFAGIHQLEWFDYALIIPYFTALVILSIYGCHRYEVIRGYFRHRKKL